MVSSLVSNISGVEETLRYVVAEMCLWFIRYVAIFDIERAAKTGRKIDADKLSKLIIMGIELLAQLIPIKYENY